LAFIGEGDALGFSLPPEHAPELNVDCMRALLGAGWDVEVTDKFAKPGVYRTLIGVNNVLAKEVIVDVFFA